MSPAALALIIAAALMHTLWNLLVKRAGNKHIFTWWALTAGAILGLPLLASPVPGRVWPYAVSSAAAEAAYFLSLVRAYEKSDFSLVYSIARGAAPAMLVMWSVIFLGERPSTLGVVGIVVLLAGLVTAGWSRAWPASRRFPPSASISCSSTS